LISYSAEKTRLATKFRSGRITAIAHRITIDQNFVFLRGFPENSFASLINRRRARPRQLSNPISLRWWD